MSRQNVKLIISCETQDWGYIH